MSRLKIEKFRSMDEYSVMYDNTVHIGHIRRNINNGKYEFAGSISVGLQPHVLEELASEVRRLNRV